MYATKGSFSMVERNIALLKAGAQLMFVELLPTPAAREEAPVIGL